MDSDLRNSLWNVLTLFYWDMFSSVYRTSDDDYLNAFIRKLTISYFKIPLDSIRYTWDDEYKSIREYYFGCSWSEVYDFIEFVANSYQGASYDKDRNTKFMAACNKIFEREVSGYRFVDGIITPITSEIEINAIEEAIEKSNQFKTVSTHLEVALQLMSDKSKPDYRNSIKESISAVEAACAIISGDSKATLGKALKIIEAKHSLHGSLKGAFDKLYGYSSDADGIRHALLEEPTLDFNDAKFMVVSCSAFVNYLIGKVKV
jgi:hypothetical protein